MADDTGNGEPQQELKKFFVDHAKSSRSTCKKCKQKIDVGVLRLAKSAYNPFGSGPMKLWHHVNCMFEVFAVQRPTTARIETPEDIEGWSDLEEEDQEEILKYLPDCKGWKQKAKTPAEDAPTKATATRTPKKKDKGKEQKQSATPAKEPNKDDSFREFRRLCATLSDTDSYTGKTAHVREYFRSGTDGSNFKGDLHLWCRLLLPGAIKRVYNLQSKQLIKLFSKIFHTDQDEMLEHVEQGDVAETVKIFFESSQHLQPAKKSALSLQDVDKFLEELSGMTKEDEQIHHFKQMAKLCTSNDLKMIIRLVKHDLRINAGPKHILEAVHPDAYQAFQTSRDLDTVLSKAVGSTDEGPSCPTKKTALTITASLMTPVLPMLPKHNDSHSKGITHTAKSESADCYVSDKSLSKKRHHTALDTSDNITQTTVSSCNTEDVDDEEEDEFAIFGNYVAHELRSLHSEEKRRDLKRIIQRAIIDMAEWDDSSELAGPSNTCSVPAPASSICTSQECSGD